MINSETIYPNLEEVLRYLGIETNSDVSADLYHTVQDIADWLAEQIQPRFLFRIFPLKQSEHAWILSNSGVILTGHTAERMLSECESAALILCTLGQAFDAMLRREQARDMARAVILDACGSALVEAGCDRVEEEISARFPHLYRTDRFSPGYGDLPLTIQPAVCEALNAGRRVGVYVTESLLLNPTKTVTAVFGLSERPQRARIRGCAFCSLRDSCTFKKVGTTCESY